MLEINQKLPVKGKKGGARAGSGRPKGATQRISIVSILETIESKTGGIPYDELLIEDFLQARSDGDSVAIMKYHQMLLNKIVADKSEVTLNDMTETIENKKRAFMEALNSMTAKENNGDR